MTFEVLPVVAAIEHNLLNVVVHGLEIYSVKAVNKGFPWILPLAFFLVDLDQIIS